ncbi:hypothetical protein BDV93DRAFT_523131 [Ceratobasidium sp. AG-I]|nr:hypothetical protein BDV93DRAFT_523131 [Ceratobasidium sp. AG-I]
MLCDLPVELLSIILAFLDLISLKRISESCRLLRAVCSDDVLNPWHHPVRRAIHDVFKNGENQGSSETLEYPRNLASKAYEALELAVLSGLSAFSTVPRSTVVDILVLSPPRFLLYHASRSNLPRRLWEEAFRRRFLPSWAQKFEQHRWSWQEGFFRTLESINHRLLSSCTSMESWINYMVIRRSGVAATCTAYARTFSAEIIMNDLKRQANLLDYPTQARIILQLTDIRVIMLGVLRRPPYFSINSHAREILHPPGVEKEKETWDESALVRPENISLPLSPVQNQTFPPGVFASSPESPAQSAKTSRRIPFAHARTRSASRERERRRDTSLRLYRTMTSESGVSSAASTSNANGSSGIIGRIRRWTLGSNDTIKPQQSGPVASPSNLPTFPNSSPSPSWTTSIATPNTTLLLNSTPNPISTVEEAYKPQRNQLPRLQHPEPSTAHAEYPNYTPGGGDTRWRIQNGLEEGGLFWVGPILILAQLVPYGTPHASTAESADEVFSQGHHVSFRWDDLMAIAPWMEEKLTRRDDGETM